MNILILRSPGDKQVAKLQRRPYKDSDFRAAMPAEILHYTLQAPFGSRERNRSLPVLGGVRGGTQASCVAGIRQRFLERSPSGALAKTGKMGIISGDGWVVAWSITRDVPQGNAGLPSPLYFYSRGALRASRSKNSWKELSPTWAGPLTGSRA